MRRGLPLPWLVVTDGAPGLIRAVEELWPEADRQRCSVHRLRNIEAKLPKRDDVRRRVKAAYWGALDDAATPEEAEANLRSLVAEIEREYPSVRRLPGGGFARPLRAPALPAAPAQAAALDEPAGALAGRSAAARARHWPLPRRGELPQSLCWAVLDLVIAGARSLGLSNLDHKELERLRKEHQLDQTKVALTA